MKEYIEFLKLMTKLKRILDLEELLKQYQNCIVLNKDCPRGCTIYPKQK